MSKRLWADCPGNAFSKAYCLHLLTVSSHFWFSVRSYIRPVDRTVIRKLTASFWCLQIPCKSAMRGWFPLNGTYFQVNEVPQSFTKTALWIIILTEPICVEVASMHWIWRAWLCLISCVSLLLWCSFETLDNGWTRSNHQGSVQQCESRAL